MLVIALQFQNDSFPHSIQVDRSDVLQIDENSFVSGKSSEFVFGFIDCVSVI